MRSLSYAGLASLMVLALGACSSPQKMESGSGGGKAKDSTKGEVNPSKGDDSDDSGDSGQGNEDTPKGDGKGKGNEDSGEESDSDSDGGEEPKFDLGASPEPKKPNDVCPIDFLFVIDNSGSMASEQENLANSVPKFIDTIRTKIKDLDEFHIGVTSTDVYSANTAPGCKKIGGLVTQVEMATDPLEKNPPPPKECGPYATGKRFMSEKDNLNKTFTCAAKLGIVGYGLERSMDSMREAVSKEMTADGACNEGFLRDDALLVVVVITDEEDSIKKHMPGVRSGSQGDPPDWHKALIEAKGGDERRVVVLGLVGTEAPNECKVLMEPDEVFVKEEGAQISPRLIEFIKLFGKRGIVGDVCASDYNGFFQKAVDTIDVACQELPVG